MFRSVAPYVGKYKIYTRLAVVAMVIGIVASVVPYFMLYQMLGPLARGEALTWAAIWPRLLVIILCEIIYALSYAKGLSLSHYSAYHTLENVRIKLQGKLEKQSLGDIEDLGNGRLKKMFTDDIEQLELLLAHAIPEGIANMLIPAIIIVVMFISDWRMGLLSLIPMVIGMFAMSMMMKAGMAKMDDYYRSGAEMNNTIIEYVNGMEVVKVFNKDGESYKTFGEKVMAYRDFTLAWYKECWPWMALYTSIFPCLCMFMLPVGSLMILHGSLTLEKLILVICMSFAVGPSFLKALNFAGKFPQLDYKIAELEKLMNHEPLKAGTNDFKGSSLDVSFENVHFGYEEEEVLHGISLKLPQKTTTALVGASGSGKSTLAKLLIHYYDIKEGKITIGGQDITDMSLEALNQQVAYVAQEQFLFNTTLYDNILVGNPTATREQVEDAARRAQCMEFLERLPQGLETQAGDGGKMLSGGERQRIALARAILKDAPIIVLDEATAFMDPENEEKMNAAIAEIVKDKTVLVIAHRLATIKDADQICVIKDGNCIAADRHEALLESCEEYKKFWAATQSASQWKIGGATC
ncbi:MAG: ABC transporter ATP-binding protein/permease [Lachnospiraceae bacterium]|nr:ABC transporter ATP-binding protein/permease [Lachnospiraceae bacterium]